MACDEDCPYQDRINELEEEVSVIFDEIEDMKEMIKENKELITSLSRAHASIIRMNEILAEKLMEKRKLEQ